MKVLITGGAGYIGSITARLFLQDGHKVTIIDNFITGKKSFLPKKCQFFKSDISNKKKIKKILRSGQFDVVLHFAALTSVLNSIKFPKKYYQNNFIKSKKFLDLCINEKIKLFVYSSTAGVYGNIKKKKISENDKTTPLNPYSKSKLYFEKYLINKCKKKKIKSLILRYFNVAGADAYLNSGMTQNNGNLIKNLCDSAINKKFFFYINGNDYSTPDGTPIRDYIHVKDLSCMHLVSTKKSLKKKNFTFAIFNCGYGKGYSVLQIIKKMNELTKNKIKFFFGPRREGDIEYSVANVSKFKQAFKWKPKFNNLNKILKSSLNWNNKFKKITYLN